MAQTIASSQSTLQRSLQTVLDPLGTPVDTKKYLSMAPRLDTLDGRTVYLVDVGFAGGYEFLEELRNWFSRHMPSTRTVLKRKPGNMFMDAPEMWAEIKDQGNAVIFGVGGCNGCSSAVAEHCRKLENDSSIPTAPITTARFADYIRRDLQAHGMPLRFSFTPYPVVGMPASRLREYVEGNDPVTGSSLSLEIIDALTKPLTSEEKKPVLRPSAPRRSRLLEPDTEENVQRLFIENGWTDGLPIVLPMEDRVAEMLEGTSHAPDEIVGQMAVAHRGEYTSYTVEKVAINAVMAGARPEHFPVILAIASTGHPAFPSSTTSFAGMVIVNGPIRSEIAMNAGLGALSPFNFANSVIGRAWTLMTINLGNARLGDTLLASTGHNLNYNNMCCAENEESSVWEPFQVEKGFKRDESVVSVFRGWSVINSMGAANSIRPANEETAIMLKAFPALHSVALLVMDPLVAKGLKEQGFQTKQDVARWLSENTKIPAGQYWGADVIYAFNAPLARAGVEPYATWSKLPKDELIAPFNDPKGINIVVVGGESNPLWLTTDFRYVTSASVDKWRPAGGLKRDAQPIRMPGGVTCSDGLCGIPS